MSLLKIVAALVVFGLALLAACADDGEQNHRELYEVHAEMDAKAAAGLFEACPGLTTVRALTAPQPGGVDVRVEFSSFTAEDTAACVEEYLLKNGAQEFETDTMNPDYSEPSSSSTT